MPAEKQVVFTPFRLDAANRRLYRGEEVIPLRPKAFAVLKFLVERPGRTVSKDDLLDAVWPDTAITDTVLKVCVRELRGALSDDPKTPRFIETVHRSGYRFIAEVTTNNLPVYLNSFVGRSREIDEVRRLLGETRLLTLVGVGGSGKTRLAACVAVDPTSNREDGVWWVDLAPLSDPGLVPQTIAATLGLREQLGRPLIHTLVQHLRDKHLCLVLDNCEHLIESCAALASDLLRACAGLTILATSREPLSIAGETAWTVPPLALPDPQRDATPGEVMESEAVCLFIERARAAHPSFAPTDQAASALARVCRHLDGIPLAIELAAPRVKTLTVDQIAARLENCLSFLTGGGRTEAARHQTLRAAIDWSYDLLSGKERTLLGRLSVFAGGWSLEAAEAICVGERIERDDTLDLLAHLIDKSLVVFDDRDGGGGARYRMLETVRQYARARLEASAETESVRRLHAGYFRKLAEDLEPTINTRERATRLAEVETEHDNLRGALRWALESGEVPTAQRLCGALWWFWFHRGYRNEGRRWLEEAIATDTGRVDTGAARAKALVGAGVLAWTQGDRSAARERLEQSVTIWRELDRRRPLAEALHFLANEMLAQGHADKARALAEESISLYRCEGSDEFGLAVTLATLGIAAMAEEQYTAARAALEESASISRRMEDNWALALSVRNLGIVAFRQGDHSGAIRFLTESLVVLRDLDEKWFISRSLETLATVLAIDGDSCAAARLFGAGEALREAVGASVLPVYRPDYDRGLEALRRRLGNANLRELWSEGRAMTVEQAVAYALVEAQSVRRTAD